jgi:hypothetical protein
MANKQEYLKRLKEAIQERHKCPAAYRRTVPVNETFKGKTIWKGEVEIFWLTGHPLSKRCYAWFRPGEAGREDLVAILEAPLVIGPATAVKAALAARPKPRG